MGDLAKSGSVSPGYDSIQKLGKGLTKDARGTEQELFGQMLEALKTGGVNAAIPIIQRSVEANKTATSGAVEGSRGNLAAAGLLDTPYGQNVLARTKTAGDVSGSQIPTNYAAEFIKMAPGFSSNILNLGTQTQLAAEAAKTQISQFDDTQRRAFYEDLKNSIQSIANMGMSASGGAPAVSTTAQPTSVSVPQYQNVPSYDSVGNQMSAGAAVSGPEQTDNYVQNRPDWYSTYFGGA